MSGSGFRIAEGYVEVGVKDDTHGGFDKISRSSQSSARSIGSHFSAVGGVIAKGLGLGVVAAGALGASALVLGVKTAAANEQAGISFTSLLGSAGKAKTFLADLTNFAAATPFDLPGVEKAAQQLLGVGMSANKVKPFLTAFGNTASALGLQTSQFNSIMTQTTQAMAQGKFQIGDLNQLASNGVPIYKLLGESFHVSQAKIIEMANAGKLTTDKVLPRLQAQMNKDYGGSMDKQSRTLTGLWSTLQDTLSQALAKGVMPLIPILGKVLPGAISAIGPVIAWFGSALAGVIGWLAKELPVGITHAKAAFDGMKPTLHDLADTFTSKVLPVIRQWIAYLVAHIPQIKKTLRDMWTAAKPMLTELGQTVRELAQIFVDKLLPVITTVAQFIATNIVPVLADLMSHAELVKSAIEVLGVAFIAFRAAMAAQAILTAISHFNDLRKAVGLMKAAQLQLNIVMEANPIGLVIAVIAALVVGVILAYQKVGWFRDLCNGAFAKVKEAATAMWERGIKPAFKLWSQAMTDIGTVIQGLWNNIVGPTIRFIVGAFLDMAGAIIHAAATAFGWLPKGIGKNLRDAAKKFDGFKNDANAAIAKVTRNLDLNVNTKPARDAISSLVRESSQNIYLHVVTIGGPGGVSGGRQVFAKGGFPHDGEFTVGEEGPELMRKSGSRLEVLTNRQLHHKLTDNTNRPGTSSTVHGVAGMHIEHLHITVNADDIRKAADVADVLLDFAGRQGTGMNRETL